MLCARRILAATLLFPHFCFSACVLFDQAQKHIGETQCVTGKVIRVEAGEGGVHYLDFCEDHRLCSFSVVIFSYDLKNVGDVRQLAGRVIEIRGELKSYDDRAEIILESARQLGRTGRLAPMPRTLTWSNVGISALENSVRRAVDRAEAKDSTRLYRLRSRKMWSRIEPGVKPPLFHEPQC